MSKTTMAGSGQRESGLTFPRARRGPSKRRMIPTEFHVSGYEVKKRTSGRDAPRNWKKMPKATRAMPISARDQSMLLCPGWTKENRNEEVKVL